MSTTEQRATPTTIPGDDVLEQAWLRYHRTAAEMHDLIRDSENYATSPEQRADGYRALLEAQAMTYNFAIAPDPAAPRIFHNTVWQTEIYTLGGNAADFDYRVTFLDGARSYRLTGAINDAAMLLGQLNRALPGAPGSGLVRNIDIADLAVDDNGEFELVLSPEPGPGQRITLDRHVPLYWILFRPTVESAGDRPAELRIELLDTASAPAEPVSDVVMAARIDAATGFLRFLVEQWIVGYLHRIHDFVGKTNEFAVLDERTSGEAGSPSAQYLMGDYRVGPDEALVVEFPAAPGGVFWSFQVYDVWLRSLEFRTRQSSLNRRQIVHDDDGRIRLVLSHRDPGSANWIDLGGRRRGMAVLRNYKSDTRITATATVIPLADLPSVLPATTRQVDPELRRTHLLARAESYLGRHGE